MQKFKDYAASGAYVAVGALAAAALIGVTRIIIGKVRK